MHLARLGLAACAWAAPAVAKPPTPDEVKARVASLPPSRAKAMLEHALTFLGTSYQWGGDDFWADGGFDCVGIVYSLFHQHGLEFPLARFSSLNMTPKPRGKGIPAVWWTAYTDDFKQTMQSCDGGPYRVGDVLVFHRLAAGQVADRTGHVVIVIDPDKGHSLSAATSGVKLHALGKKFEFYGDKALTGCWRAASADKAPYARAALTWELSFPKTAGQVGTESKPYKTPNPATFTFTVTGPGVKALNLDVTARVRSFISFVSPTVTEIPSQAADQRRFQVTHDFKAVDLPVDPGERIPTPRRKIALRLIDKDGFVAGEKDFYVQLTPYW